MWFQRRKSTKYAVSALLASLGHVDNTVLVRSHSHVGFVNERKTADCGCFSVTVTLITGDFDLVGY